MSKEPYQSDAYPPVEIARKVERLGEAKAHTDTLTLLVLAMLAGAFISMGALFFTVVVTGNNLGFGLTRLLG
jgi:formate/nitrite transporter FocA (FNT family)